VLHGVVAMAPISGILAAVARGFDRPAAAC
jgi:hypothetical protein